MILNFESIPESVLTNFKGGEKSVNAHMFVDPMCRIMRGHLVSGASIGLHTHEDSCEIIFCISGSAKVIYDGEELRISAGEAHYCPKGHSHTLINDTDGVMQFLAVVPQQ